MLVYMYIYFPSTFIKCVLLSYFKVGTIYIYTVRKNVR